MKKYLSIDIGGTLIKYGILLETGELLYKKDRQRLQTWKQ